MRRRRGVALLLVLWLVVLLAMVTVAASGAARNSSYLVNARRAEATARSMAESGLAVATVAIGDSLRRLASDSSARDRFLNALDAATAGSKGALASIATDTIGNGAFAIAVVDVSARLDVNETSADGLTRFLSSYTAPAVARDIAERVAARVRGDGNRSDSASVAQATRDSLVNAMLGQPAPTMRIRHPFESLDELSSIAGFDEKLLLQVAPLLTVDGDARVNRQAAPRVVISAAAGTMVDAPSRLLVVTRGWQLGHPLTHEVQAVYDVTPTGLTLVRWRERNL